MRFSLQTLLTLVAIAAILSAAARSWPHAVILIIGILPAPFLTFRFMLKALSRRKIGMLLPLTSMIAWLAFYVVGIGPCLVLIIKGYITMPIFDRVYRPLFWACEDTILRDLLHWYIRLWWEAFTVG